MPVTYYHLRCICGHESYVALSRWLHQDELRARATCGRCHCRQIKDVVMVPQPEQHKMWSQGMPRDLQVIEVWLILGNGLQIVLPSSSYSCVLLIA
ncbi:MAG: hypothetical protein VYB46_10575 [Pseudomonadota bacterium]|nr:hypothetical protein [Pseudomonadota bacterium]